MNKILQLLGISLRSRHLICGTDSVINNLQKNKLYLIFIAKDASENLIDKIEKKAFYYNVKVIKEYDSIELSKITNKQAMVYGIDDQGLANAVIKELEK